MTTRALLSAPASAPAGSIVDIRALLQHPMESGFRVDANGRPIPRSIVRRVEARFSGDLVFAADLHPAIAANPYLQFAMRLDAAGELVVTWRGDEGFEHTERLRMALT
jgi:sulfur-oxidizing protein SoxZ